MAGKMNTENARHPVLANEEGVAIITTLLILMLLTFIGITATKTTITEKKIVRSEAIFERSFYLAESAAMEGIQKLENESTPEELLASRIVAGVSNNDGLLVSTDANEPENDWKNIDSNDDNVIDGNDYQDSELDPDNETHRLVVQAPIANGNSLALGSSRLYDYFSYGLTESEGGRAMIKVGYKKRF